MFWRAKRTLDLMLSVLLLPVLVSVGALLVLLNPLGNPGPLLFFQPRLGWGGVPFVLIKFRTMRPGNGPARFADADAHRITRLGRVLRRTHLDELPQVINVLRGEMSLIGPRPEQVSFAQDYARDLPDYELRYMVRPGVSGLSQVLEGYTSDLPGARRKLAHDLRYIRDSGVRMEGFVIWRTLLVLLPGGRARRD